MKRAPVVLCILDGVGWGRRDDTDAVYMADTPVLDRLIATHPHTLLRAHGTAVGLPSDADMGNSEVGHNAMGAGRVIEQGARLVDSAIASGAIFENPVWTRACAAPTLHLLGLVSDGNVHSHVAHLRALIARAAADGVRRIRVHALTDGRDVSERSALTWIEPLEAELATLRGPHGPVDARVASGGGRMAITMDRYEADWPMVKRGWDCHVHGVGRRFASAAEAIRAFYAEDPAVNDQNLPAFVCDDRATGLIRDDEAVIFFNFRGDRAIEISRAFTGSAPIDLRGPDGAPGPRSYYAGMMQYDGDLKLPAHYLVEPPAIDQTVGLALVAAGRRTLAVSETQKFGHVTYFFNGNRSGRLSDTLERYVEVPSDVVSFDQKPDMKAAEIADVVVDALAEGGWDHIRLNLANGDMVGHTGDFAATVRGMEAVDRALGRIVDACEKAGAVLIVTADHGNADGMYELDKQGRPLVSDGRARPRTSHTLNPVPFVLVDPTGTWALSAAASATGPDAPGIAQIGATLLRLLDVPAPSVYLPALVTEARP